jgi:Zn-dependent M16 (insulinase) family peptidase
MGTEQQDYVSLSHQIGMETGGIRTTQFISAVRGDDTGTAWLFLRGKSVTDKSETLLGILTEVLNSVRLDNQERFRQMVLEEKARLESGLVPGGHRFVNTRLRSHFNTADHANERMRGIEYLFKLRELAGQIEKDWTGVLGRLENIRGALVDRRHALVNVTLDPEGWPQVQGQLTGFLERLPSVGKGLQSWSHPAIGRSEGLTIPAQVNYVGQGADLFRLGYQSHGSILAITKYMRTAWLWDKIRVQGGAYGAFNQFNRHSGVFTFLSYRDPNILKTLDVYDQTAQYIRDLDISEGELTKSIIGAIGDMDSYRLPDAKGYVAMLRHLLGDSDARRQQLRDQLLGTTVGDFRAFGEVMDAMRTSSLTTVLGSAQAIDEANQRRPGLLQVQRIL